MCKKYYVIKFLPIHKKTVRQYLKFQMRRKMLVTFYFWVQNLYCKNIVLLSIEYILNICSKILSTVNLPVLMKHLCYCTGVNKKRKKKRSPLLNNIIDKIYVYLYYLQTLKTLIYHTHQFIVTSIFDCQMNISMLFLNV